MQETAAPMVKSQDTIGHLENEIHFQRSWAVETIAIAFVPRALLT